MVTTHFLFVSPLRILPGIDDNDVLSAAVPWTEPACPVVRTALAFRTSEIPSFYYVNRIGRQPY